MSDMFQQYAGRYKLDHVLLKSLTQEVDITELAVEFNVYSSIIDVTNVCRVVITDARNFLSNFPVKGGMELEIKVSYLDTSHTYSFITTGVESIQEMQGQRMYAVTAISRLAYTSNYQKISQHFNGTTSEIAFRIFEKTGESYGVWNNSLGKENIIVPNWSPLRTINWLASRSRAVNDAVRFRFFQDSVQNYHFMPIESALELYKERPPLTYSYFKNTNRTMQNGEEIPNSAADMLSIEKVEYHDAFNIVNALRSGMLAGTRLSHDYTFKQTNVLTYNHFNQFRPNNYLNSQPLFPEGDYGPGFINYSMSPKNLSGDTGVPNHVDDISSIRKSTLYGEMQTVSITVKGNQTVDIAQVLNIEIPSPEPRSEGMRDQKDLNWSGKYYVIGKRDMYNRDGKTMVLDLAKESLMKGAAE